MASSRLLRRLVLYSCVLAAALSAAADIDVAKWYGRSIYFVVTDRFARDKPAEDGDKPCAGKGWCGGTLRGVLRKLDYIANMGFDAIWITPVVKQVPWLDNWNGTGYHGYWAADFFSIEPHIGSEADLQALQRGCEARGMLLMLDVVANHVGPIHNVQQVQSLGSPLNSMTLEQFHQLGRQPGESFESYVTHPVPMWDAGAACWPNYNFDGGCNYTVILEGWFGDLADLRQEDPKTRDYLLRWIAHMVTHYRLDGIRLDTALYMPKSFLEDFQKAAGVYMIGEVVTYNISMHQSFAPALSGLLNFPITEKLKHIFSSNGSLVDLHDLLQQQNVAGYPDLNLLGNFVDNHDGERFLHNHSGDVLRLQNALAWTLLYHGLPIVYYGTEQVEVSNRADERTSMWPHYGTTDLYRFLRQLNNVRRQHGLASGGAAARSHATVVAATQTHFAFVRGSLLILVTNAGADAPQKVCAPLSSFPTPWAGVCSAAIKPVVGNASAPRCESGRLCMQTASGLPSVFAVGDLSGFFV
eukprot:TRINITY_DN19671_c0_g1_i1.p1 TRINITY_DN19671_c0_g1~~TRINITY_DN19671_c0_g1_i1.p1  ORF type:complete len:526 (+),score=76.41 TRINITY_DN19671_c0_g1_i1:58-1635(+)